jgi:hypothetical protein
MTNLARRRAAALAASVRHGRAGGEAHAGDRSDPERDRDRAAREETATPKGEDAQLHLKQVRAAVGSDAGRTFELRMPDSVLLALARAHARRRSGTFTLIAGTVRVVVQARLRL